jgi:hypothetical protein
MQKLRRSVGWLGLVALGALMVSVYASVTLVTFPYRGTWADGERFRLWGWIWLAGWLVAGSACVLSLVWRDNKSRQGVSLAGLGAVVVVVLFGGPAGAHSFVSAKNVCINNLRQIDGAKEQWALENAKPVGATANEKELSEFLRGKRWEVCPKGGKYFIGNVGEEPRCSVAGHTL